MNTPQTHYTHFPDATGPELVPCPECGAPFKPKRKWQKFCTPPCRQRHHRKPHDTAKMLERIEALEARVAKLEGGQ